MICSVKSLYLLIRQFSFDFHCDGLHSSQDGSKVMQMSFHY